MERRFWQKFAEGEIHFRDDYQFELKSEFSPHPNAAKNRYSQEFYLFVPDALQITPSSYSREEFYRDQTSLIRYKTPEMSFEELLDSDHRDSPIWRLSHGEELHDKGKRELKLLGNIIRSQLRDRVRELVVRLEQKDQAVGESCVRLVQDLRDIRSSYRSLPIDKLSSVTYRYVGEFIDVSMQLYLTGCLEELRRQKTLNLGSADHAIVSFIKETNPTEVPMDSSENEQEFVLYRKGLLNKFVLDALFLWVDRKAVLEQYQGFTAMFAAGLAMFIYMLLFIWQGEIFVFNSFPFVMITVFLYILKDRLKEGIKTLYAKRAFRWFPDFETEIRNPSQEQVLGKLTESFSFMKLSNAPEEVLQERNEGFHAELEAFKRPETLLFFKREVNLRSLGEVHVRRSQLNTIFRFNVFNFLKKASNAWQSFPTLDRETNAISRISLPKVYHLNIIVRNRYFNEKGAPEVELQKFRCVLDKRGIKRVERIS